MATSDRASPVPGPRPARGWHRSRWLWAGAVAVILAAAGVTAALIVVAPGPSLRDEHWRRDVSYLASELPRVRVTGITPASRAAWNAAAARLEARVPRLTDGQVITGMARMVAMLHDDETEVLLPRQQFYEMDAQWFGRGLYILAIPGAEHSLLGARLLAVDGRPVAQVLARIRPVIDAQDAGLRSEETLGGLDNFGLLHWLGITRSASSERLTVVTAAGRQRTVTVTPTGSGDIYFPDFLAVPDPGLAHAPRPEYLQHLSRPYWLKVEPAQHAVYLKYNECLDDDGFQRLAAQALAVLRANPGDRLIVDLRDNLGGDTQPFTSLITGIRANPAVNQPGRVIGLVDHFTDSAATADAGILAAETRAVLIGTAPADPIDEYGDERTFQLPESGLTIQYTSGIVKRGHTPLGIPGIMITPTLHQVLTGADPVLAAALSYRSPAA